MKRIEKDKSTAFLHEILHHRDIVTIETLSEQPTYTMERIIYREGNDYYSLEYTWNEFDTIDENSLCVGRVKLVGKHNPVYVEC